VFDRHAVDGQYRLIDDPPRRLPIALISGATPATIAAAVIPLDADFPVRVETAYRLWRILNGHPSIQLRDRLTNQQRQRLTLTLRALDAKLENEVYRVIARGLFGERVPDGRAWKTHDLQSRTRRLVHAGIELMQGGYLGLLRSPLRARD
jgi:hypothetical protein